MKKINSLRQVIGGALLVASTAVGVGMLALPVATGSAGFIPSAFIYIICWIFMACTGLLLVEANVWMPKDTGFLSMAEKILGPAWKAVAWVIYLFLFITVMIAHASGGGAVLSGALSSDFPAWASTLIYTAILSPVIYMGARFVDRLNIFMISCVILCYLAFIAVSISYVDIGLLSYSNWKKAPLALPILFTAFTYQVIIPTLMNYMNRDAKKVRLAVIIGSVIPLVIYLVWEFLIMGIIPSEGPGGLIEASVKGENAVGPLKEFINNPNLLTISKFFAFFAMTTSYIPLALSFFDFLADGLKWKKDGLHRFLLTCLVFGLPLSFALIYPHIFLTALGYAGGISCALLFGVMPPLMVWMGRYVKRFPQVEDRLPGGKTTLIILIGFSMLILAGQILQQFI